MLATEAILPYTITSKLRAAISERQRVVMALEREVMTLSTATLQAINDLASIVPLAGT